MSELKFKIERPQIINREIEYKIRDVNNFFGLFRNSYGGNIWCGVITKESQKFFVAIKDVNRYEVIEYANWQSFDLQIKGFFRENEFQNEITREEFLGRIPFNFQKP